MGQAQGSLRSPLREQSLERKRPMKAKKQRACEPQSGEFAIGAVQMWAVREHRLNSRSLAAGLIKRREPYRFRALCFYRSSQTT